MLPEREAAPSLLGRSAGSSLMAVAVSWLEGPGCLGGGNSTGCSGPACSCMTAVMRSKRSSPMIICSTCATHAETLNKAEMAAQHAVTVDIHTKNKVSRGAVWGGIRTCALGRKRWLCDQGGAP
jgi:hypothetical protein